MTNAVETYTASDLHVRARELRRDGDAVRLNPDTHPALLAWCGLRVVELAAGASCSVSASDQEYVVLPMRGGARVDFDNTAFELTGRLGPFDGVTDVAYLPRDTAFTVTAANGNAVIALPHAHARQGGEAAYLAADDVPVETRGAGRSTRQLNNFLAPGMLGADRLTCVEVLTPAGNWSSIPPHKHDEQSDTEAELEEIYWYAINGAGGYGLHRTYDPRDGWDVTAAVFDGDAFLVPRGYHGPCAAPPGHDMYYLNILAGPAPERSLAFSDDPDHAWLRTSWEGEECDPRVPLTRPVKG